MKKAVVGTQREPSLYLPEASELFEALAHHPLMGLYVIQDNLFKYVSPRVTELLGYSEDELVGEKGPEDVVHSEDRLLVRNNIRARLAGEVETAECSFRIVNKSGEVIEVEIFSSRTDCEGRPAVVGTILDITERKRAEEETRRRAQELSVLYTISRSAARSLNMEERLNDSLWATLDVLRIEAGGIFLLDAEGDVLTLRVHRGLSDDFVSHVRQVRRGEGAAGQAIAKKEPVVLDVANYPTERLAPYIAQEGFQTVASTPLISAGEVVGALTLATRRTHAFPPHQLELLAGIGHLLGGAVLNAQLHGKLRRELADRKQAEEELRQTAEDLRRSNTDLEQFAYVASHDLQEPLRMVTSYVQLLGRRYKGKLDADADEFIGYVVDGAARMQVMIEDLLAYSRVSTRGEPLARADSEKALSQALSNLQASVKERGAVVTHDVLPTVHADALQLTQLFQNLVANAIKFRGEEPPTVHISAEQEDGEWVFSVRDNGIGVDPVYHERIFEIFQRLHPVGEYPGTGIGLAMCKKIVERHRGRIWVDSALGQGATFRFTIPTRKGEQP